MKNEHQELEELLEQRRKNLRRIQKQLAVYAVGEEPIYLLNQQSTEVERIKELQERLAVYAVVKEPQEKTKIEQIAELEEENTTSYTPSNLVSSSIQTQDHQSSQEIQHNLPTTNVHPSIIILQFIVGGTLQVLVAPSIHPALAIIPLFCVIGVWGVGTISVSIQKMFKMRDVFIRLWKTFFYGIIPSFLVVTEIILQSFGSTTGSVGVLIYLVLLLIGSILGYYDVSISQQIKRYTKIKKSAKVILQIIAELILAIMVIVTNITWANATLPLLCAIVVWLTGATVSLLRQKFERTASLTRLKNTLIYSSSAYIVMVIETIIKTEDSQMGSVGTLGYLLISLIGPILGYYNISATKRNKKHEMIRDKENT
ncbi:MAG: hypothetical protein AAF639_10095 [Chloroflexota bacterium]